MKKQASPVKYNFDLLTKYCNENHITLLKDYSDEKITRKTIIKGKCLTELCLNTFEKNFRQLIDVSNAYCKKCTKNNTNKKKKINSIEKYGTEYPIQSEEVKKKIKVTCLKRYGVEYSTQSKEIKEKSKLTCLKKYGFEYPSQSEEVKEKIKETCLEKYGVKCPLQSKEVIEKIKETCLEKYGVKCPFQSKEVMEKIKETCLEKYGVEYPTQSEEIREKSKITCLEKYGVEHPQQNSEISERTIKSSYSRKYYKFPSGKIIQVQGYEPYALDKLIKIFNEEDIITGTSSVPEIWYDDDRGIKHRHYVDIFIPSQNKLIEVKSTWTVEMKNDNIFKKQEAGKQLGYNYEIWIFNRKGDKVECIS